MRVVLIIRDLLPVGLASRNDADGRTPHRIDDDIHAPVDRAEQPVAVLAIVPPAVLRDDPVRIEERPDGIGEVEAAMLESGTVLGLVPFELHPHIYRPMAYYYQARVPSVCGDGLPAVLGGTLDVMIAKMAVTARQARSQP